MYVETFFVILYTQNGYFNPCIVTVKRIISAELEHICVLDVMILFIYSTGHFLKLFFKYLFIVFLINRNFVGSNILADRKSRSEKMPCIHIENHLLASSGYLLEALEPVN